MAQCGAGRVRTRRDPAGGQPWRRSGYRQPVQRLRMPLHIPLYGRASMSLSLAPPPRLRRGLPVAPVRRHPPCGEERAPRRRGTGGTLRRRSACASCATPGMLQPAVPDADGLSPLAAGQGSGRGLSVCWAWRSCSTSRRRACSSSSPSAWRLCSRRSSASCSTGIAGFQPCQLGVQLVLLASQAGRAVPAVRCAREWAPRSSPSSRSLRLSWRISSWRTRSAPAGPGAARPATAVPAPRGVAAPARAGPAPRHG